MLNTGADLLQAVGEEDDERLPFDVAVAQFDGEGAFSPAEPEVDVLRAARCVLQVPEGVALAVLQVAAGIARHQVEEFRLNVCLSEVAMSFEEGHFVRLVDHVEGGHQFGELERAVPAAIERAERRLAEAAAVGESALAERLHLVPGVVDLGAKEQLHIVEAVADRLEPFRDDLLLGEAVRGVHRGQLADSAFNFFRKFGQSVLPVEVGGRDPALANCLFVQFIDAFGPDFVLVVDVVRAGGVGVHVGVAAEWSVVLVGPNVRHLAIRADVDLRRAEAMDAGDRAHAAFALGAHEVEGRRANGRRVLRGLRHEFGDAVGGQLHHGDVGDRAIGDRGGFDLGEELVAPTKFLTTSASSGLQFHTGESFGECLMLSA